MSRIRYSRRADLPTWGDRPKGRIDWGLLGFVALYVGAFVAIFHIGYVIGGMR